VAGSAKTRSGLSRGARRRDGRRRGRQHRHGGRRGPDVRGAGADPDPGINLKDEWSSLAIWVPIINSFLLIFVGLIAFLLRSQINDLKYRIRRLEAAYFRLIGHVSGP